MSRDLASRPWAVSPSLPRPPIYGDRRLITADSPVVGALLEDDLRRLMPWAWMALDLSGKHELTTTVLRTTEHCTYLCVFFCLFTPGSNECKILLARGASTAGHWRVIRKETLVFAEADEAPWKVSKKRWPGRERE